MSERNLPVVLDTNEAAKELQRNPQTLRVWACRGTGPIRPLRIGGRLGWKLEDIRKLLEGQQ